MEDVYTIGHSTHPIDRLVQLLRQHAVTAVADVRSRPYSRMNPQFNREPLRDALRSSRIAYVFLGAELGARSDDSSCYCNGKVQYDRLAATEGFRHGVERVREGASVHRIALMCAEKDPLHCHRTILVARHLVSEGLRVRHILGNGLLEDHDEAIARLMSNLRLPLHDMFKSKDELAAEAYRLQGEAIAYEERNPGSRLQLSQSDVLR